MTKALILVDIQNDFLPGGALAVPDGDQVIAVANRLIEAFDLVVATQDWHPASHGSFASQHAGHEVGQLIELSGLEQILWPDHCIQGTSGAEFAANLNMTDHIRVFPKGTDPSVDSYSGFFDNGRRKATGLGDFLKQSGVTHTIVLGLATDYCVRFTALDAKSLNFDVTLVEDGCRGVNLNAGDVDRTLEELEAAGIRIANSRELLTE
ncbi:MAG: bifunctional nicotinamidase/pyrazinamidase [Planctomycetaceae bacterium]